MNDNELRKILGGLKTPAPDEAKRDQALYHAQLALKNGPLPAEPAARRWSLNLWQWGTGLAMGIVIGMITMWALKPREMPAPHATGGPAPSLAVFEQMETLFSGRLDAMVSRSDNEDVQVLLAPENTPASDQRIWARLEDGGTVINVMTYSGQHVCVDLAGKSLCVEVLAKEDGGVLLVGDGFLWESGQSSRAGNLRIKAQVLAQEAPST